MKKILRRIVKIIMVGYLVNENLTLTPRPLAAGTKSMGFPKGRSKALPFGRLRGTYPADDIKLINTRA